jgi:hypothetical protein
MRAESGVGDFLAPIIGQRAHRIGVVKMAVAAALGEWSGL